MRLYWEVARCGFRRYATYRGATVAGIFTNTVFGFIKAYVLIALFAARPVLGGYRITDALTYGFVAQGLLATVAIWGWLEIEERVPPHERVEHEAIARPDRFADRPRHGQVPLHTLRSGGGPHT
jgi:ABC-type uncharacterized transport system permease subunit